MLDCASKSPMQCSPLAETQCLQEHIHLSSGACLGLPAFPALPLIALLLPALLQALIDLLCLPGLEIVQRAAHVQSGPMQISFRGGGSSHVFKDITEDLKLTCSRCGGENRT